VPLALHQDGRIGVPLIHQMLAWEQVSRLQGRMHHRPHMVVRGGGRRGLDIHNQVGRVRVTGFREVDFVPDPLQMALGAVARIGVIEGGQLVGCRRHLLDLPPAQLPVLFTILLTPDVTERDNRRNLCKPGLVGGAVNRLEQTLAVFANDQREFLPRRFGLGQVIVLDPTAVTLEPLWWHPLLQPRRREDRQRIQGGPEGLPDWLQALQHPHGGSDVRRIGPLPTACLEQAGLPDALQPGYPVTLARHCLAPAESGIHSTRYGQSLRL
jgi:hypothetical protein